MHEVLEIQYMEETREIPCRLYVLVAFGKKNSITSLNGIVIHREMEESN